VPHKVILVESSSHKQVRLCSLRFLNVQTVFGVSLLALYEKCGWFTFEPARARLAMSKSIALCLRWRGENEGQLIFPPEFTKPQCVPIPAAQWTSAICSILDE
jgi:hypothetical protein